MPSNNPYSSAYAAIESALARWPAWAALVVPGNRINQQVPSFQPQPVKAAAGDRAEAQLVEVRLGIDPLTVNSKAVAFRALYRLDISSGVFGPDRMNLLVIETARALLASTGPQTGRLIGADAAFYKWEIKPDLTATARDALSGRKEWSTAVPIMAYFQMGRDDFMTSVFT